MAVVSVVVATRNPGSALPGLVRSLDAQTLPRAHFEVVVVDSSDDGSADRLRQLAGHRPNVTVLPAEAAEPEEQRVARGLQQASGEYLLVLGQRQRLAPRALELLLDRARRSGADVVLGRVVDGVASGSTLLPDDTDRWVSSDGDLHGVCAMVRRSGPLVHADRGAAVADLPALARAARVVSAVGRYAVATADGRPKADESVALQSSEYGWAGGALHLKAVVRLPASVPSGGVRGWLVLARDDAEVALPATLEADGGRPGLSAVLDPATAEGGHPLEDGAWELGMRVAWPGREVTLPFAPGPARSAVLGGRPATVRRERDRLVLDAGATRSSVIGPLPPSRTTIAETARGTVVTLQYPTVHVTDDAVLDARLLLDGFALPARLVCRDGRARMEAYASGLAGSSAVSVLAGGGRPVATGLRLTIDGVGRMQLQAVAPTTSAGAPRSSTPLVRRLRQRVPPALEPTARRLARVPALARIYRRLLSR